MVRVRTLFFPAPHFHLALVPLAFLILSPPRQNFLAVLPTKSVSFVFYLCSRSLSPFFSLSFAGLQPNFSFSMSFSYFIFYIYGHGN